MAKPPEHDPSEEAYADKVEEALKAFWGGNSIPLEELLVDSDDATVPPVAKLLGGVVGQRNDPSAKTRRPTQIGDYRIIRELGRGGMGVVYEAEQQSPRRPVALKVVRGGAYVDEHHVRLFQREAQALARLKHPFIGGIYEAGRTDDGQHFFAMELVRGVPLLKYVSVKKPPIRERLALFCKICEAINYAHQRGVMHRDLKPGNILIDADGNPKILDFGLAKITDADIAVTTVVTEIGKIQGTLPYMSPEQARGNPDEIDLRSDVYSLGVILYELMTDQRPYELGQAMLHEAVRVICEAPPRKPSTIIRQLRGDLETIALKALEKEPRRRYQSATAFAEDIERYLTDQPIQARPPRALYQFRKLVARHKAAFAFVGVLFVVAVGSGALMSIQAERNRQLAESERRAKEDALAARDRAREAQAETQKRADELRIVTEFQESMLGEIDARQLGRALFDDLRAQVRESLEAEGISPAEIDSVIDGLNYTLHRANATDIAVSFVDEQLLGRAARAIETDFADQTLVRAALQQTVATTYCKIGRYLLATPLQEAALDTRRAELGVDHPDTLASIDNMGYVLYLQSKLVESEPYFRQALEGRRRVLGDDHPDTLRSIGHMAWLLESQRKPAEAEGFCREALDGRRRVLGDDHPNTLTSINDMGALLQAQGKLAEAEPYYRESLEGHRRVLGEDHPDTLASIHNMGGLLVRQGKLAEAESYYCEALEGCRRALGNDHPDTLTSIRAVGGLLVYQGKLAEAVSYHREALEGCRRVLGNDHPDTLKSIDNMGGLFRRMGKLEQALGYRREALEGCRRVLGNDHPDTLKSIDNMGGLFRRMGKLEQALGYRREALEGRRRVLGDDHPDTLASMRNLALLLEEQGLLAEAEALYREVVAGRRRVLGDKDPETASSLIQLGVNLVAQERSAEAEPVLRECLKLRQDILEEGHWLTFSAKSVLGEALVGRGAFTEARPLLVGGLAGLQEKSEDIPDRFRTARLREAHERIVQLFDTWHAAEPDKGYDQKAAEWRAKLEAVKQSDTDDVESPDSVANGAASQPGPSQGEEVPNPGRQGAGEKSP